MNTYHDIYEEAAMPWPYEVKYGQETRVTCDVLVLGGGIAGCRAAIAAAKEGAEVVVVDKAPIKRSGTGGTGHDHWLSAATNPASKVTPEEFVEKGGQNWMVGPIKYILPKTGWDALAELEEMGLEIRDAHDEFKGAPFRDEKSKLLFCYDYENKVGIRLFGGNQHKPVLSKELERLNVRRFERVMTTRLLYKIFFPWADIASWGELQVLKKEDGEVKVRYVDPYYELQAPYKPTYRENFYEFNPDYDENYKAKEDDAWTHLKQY